MIVSKFYRFVLSVTIMMLAATVCWAVGGSISGTVKDSSGGVIPGSNADFDEYLARNSIQDHLRITRGFTHSRTCRSDGMT